MTDIDELTSEQTLLIPSYLQEWEAIAFSTQESTVKKQRKRLSPPTSCFSVPLPEIKFFDSLYAAAEAAKPLYGRDRPSSVLKNR